jgi:hypothetical protein
MKKWLIGAGIALLLLGVGGWWIWSLGSVSLVEPQARIVLKIETQGVDVRASESEEWKTATDGMELVAGSAVRTDEQGRASIVFFDSSVTRLRPASSISLEEAAVSRERGETMSVRIKLLSGRVWSRIINVFDLGSSFSVRTDQVVATVRGTAFDVGMSTSGTTLWVSDSAVEVTGQDRKDGTLVSGAPFYVGEGNMVLRDNRGWSAIEALSATDTGSDWFRSNTNADMDFGRGVRKNLSKKLANEGDAHVGSFLERFTRFSEAIHMRFAGPRAGDLYATYAGRRLIGIVSLIDRGMSGLAFQAFTTLESDVKEDLKDPKHAGHRLPLRHAVRQAIVLLDDVAASSPQYRLRQRLEDLNDLLAGDDRAALLYGRLLAIDAGLATASRLIDERALEEAGMSLDAAHQGIVNVTSDLENAASGMSDVQASDLRAKRDAVLAREAAVRAKLAAALAPPTVPEDLVPTSTTMTPTSTTPVQTPRPTTPTSTGKTLGPWTRITLSAQPNPVQTGSATQLRVMGIKADGTSEDATAYATFKLIGSLGSLNGATYMSSQPGSVTIEASVKDASGVVKTATVIIEVQQAVVLSNIEIIPQGETTVIAGTQVPVVVKAMYTSGMTSLVTSMATWLTSDANIGSVANGLFTAWVNGQGLVTITTTYTEAGVTKSTSIVFTVIPPGTAKP